MIRVIMRHDLTKKKDNDEDKHKYKDNDKDKYIQRTHSKSDPRDLWPLRHMIRVIMRHDLTKKQIMTKTNTNTKTMTMTKTNTFREHIQKSDHRDLWPLRHVIRVILIHDRTNQKTIAQTMTKTNTNTNTETMTRCVKFLHFRQLRTWLGQSLRPDN